MHPLLGLVKTGAPLWLFFFPWSGPALSLTSFLWVVRVFRQPAWVAILCMGACSLAEAVAGKALHEYLQTRRLEPIHLEPVVPVPDDAAGVAEKEGKGATATKTVARRRQPRTVTTKAKQKT